MAGHFVVDSAAIVDGKCLLLARFARNTVQYGKRGVYTVLYDHGGIDAVSFLFNV